MGRLLVSLLLLATFCLGAAISYFNWTTVSFDYLAGQAELPLIGLLLSAFVLGMAVMGLLNLARVFTLGRETRRQTRRIRELEGELRSLRNLPLAGATGAAAETPPSPPGKNA